MRITVGEGFLILLVALLFCGGHFAEAWIHEAGATERAEMHISAEREAQGIMMQWQNTRDKMSAQPFMLPLPSLEPEPEPKSKFPSA